MTLARSAHIMAVVGDSEAIAAPTARMLAVLRSRRVRDVMVRCPFGCRSPHLHGWPLGNAEIGWRVSHRADGGRPYFIGAA